MEDVAREAGVSRPTVYRQFPGGRDALFRDVVAWEATRFINELTRAIAPHTELADVLEELVAVASARLEEHQVLQKVLQTEPDRLLPILVLQNARLISLVRPFLLLALQRHDLPSGVDAEAAADYLARMLLSVVASPGSWDLTDRVQIATFVRTQLLGGLH
jgi:AcrR family transcriptional regulator